MSKNSVHQNKYLRDEFNQQRIGGIPDYYQWLVSRLLEAERNANNNDMAAAENFRLWQQEKAENERMKAVLDQITDCYPKFAQIIDKMLGKVGR